MKKSLSILITVLILAAASITLFAQSTADKLASGTYTVYAKSPQVWRFTFDPKTMGNASVSGHFKTMSGTPASLDVFVLSEADFTKWRKDDAAAPAGAKPLFSSVKKGEGDLSAKLTDAGSYYVVFSDLYEYEGTKTFSADIKFQYDKH